MRKILKWKKKTYRGIGIIFAMLMKIEAIRNKTCGIFYHIPSVSEIKNLCKS